jgi:hypothetical protein
MDTTREPVLTPRLRLGLGALALGLGSMFLFGKVLPSPLAAGIAASIAVAAAGFVLVIVEALRSPPEPTGAASGDRDRGTDPDAR